MDCITMSGQYYEETFEAEFLRKTGEYYKQESQKLFDLLSCSEYMEKVCSTISLILLSTQNTWQGIFSF